MAGRYRVWRGWIRGAGLLLAAGLAMPAAAAPSLPITDQAPGDETTDYGVPLHPLEIQALHDPGGVLVKLPAAIDAARAANDHAELARLHLAHANACRVVADWACQRDAGARAQRAALLAGNEPLQVVRGIIAESRGSIALQDFTRGEQLLSKAQLALRANPSPVLTADVFLAYSSLCNQIAKYKLSVDYADRGLEALSGSRALPMQVRLLRNKATALASLGDHQGALASLAMARAMATRIDDPKLSAEVLLVTARLARLSGDVATQVESGRGVLAHAERLHNAQLAGLGHETLGLAAIGGDDLALAERELGEAQQVFQEYALYRDELRVLRELIRLKIERGATVEASPLVNRFLEQERALDQSERAQASDDFEARVKYAESEMQLVRLEGEAAMARERERALARDNRLTLWLLALGLLTTGVLAAFFLQQRRSNRRLTDALALLRESEAQGQDLLRLSTGFVFLHDLAGRLMLVNPAAAHALGQSPEALVGQPLAAFLVDSESTWADYATRILGDGIAEGVLRVRCADGERHWRVSSRRTAPREARAYVVGNAVDVTAQVLQADALREQSERDALTGCWNRRKLEVFEDSHLRDGWAAVVIDLDHFKRINDTEGHERGDRVLVGIAGFLHERVRAVDALVRVGGDEFVLLLPGVDAGHVDALVARLLNDAALAPCAFSLGAAVRDGGEALADTVARADAAMYAGRARRRGTARTEA
jgi:diguanylate cyclase (GGDEF)-like protein/PAS domain S-box-containing protein